MKDAVTNMRNDGIPDGWRIATIESLCKRVTSGATPLRSNPAFYENGIIPWFKTKELNDWYVDDSEEKITQIALENSSVKLFPSSTVLMAMYGDGRTITTLGILRKESATNQACCALIVDPTVCDHLFLFYALKYHRDDFIHLALGGAQRNLSGKLIRKFMIKVPPLETQRKIAGLLSVYDRLIENNRKRIQILEEMAWTLYREWFVHLRYPGHENDEIIQTSHGPTPKGWDWANLFEIADVTFGKALKSKYFSEKSKGFPIVRIRDLPNNCTNTSTTESAENKYIVKNGDILVGMDGDFHMCRWAGGDAYLVQRVARFRPRSSISPYFLFWALKKHIEYFNATIIGTTVAHLGKKHLETVNILVPRGEIMEKANQIFNPLYQQEINLRTTNVISKDLRDFLLPKLVSGEIDVSTLDIDTSGD